MSHFQMGAMTNHQFDLNTPWHHIDPGTFDWDGEDVEAAVNVAAEHVGVPADDVWNQIEQDIPEAETPSGSIARAAEIVDAWYSARPGADLDPWYAALDA